MKPWRGAILFSLACAIGIVWIGGRAQTPAKVSKPVYDPGRVPASSKTSFPPRPAPPCCGYPFPRSTDAEIADGDVHRVLYEDQHIMFLEVANPPLLDVHMHGHPFASVFTHDSNGGGHNPAAPPTPPGGNDPKLDPNTPYNDMGSGDG